MRGKYIALLIVAVLAAAGAGVGTAYVRQAGRPAAKIVLPAHEDLKSFVQTANAWITGRQKTAGLSLYMADTQNGWRNDGQNLFHTTDGGKSWNAAAPFYDGGAVDFVDAAHAFALAKAVHDEEALTGISVYATADSGKDWRHLALSGAPYFSAEGITRGADGFTMADRLHGLLVLAGDPAAGSHESAVFSTKDGGHSFTQQASGLRMPNGQTTLALADASHAYLFVNGSAAPVFLLASTDGGKTWKEQDGGLSPRFTDVTPAYVPVRMASDGRVALLSEQNGTQASGAKGKTETADTRMRNVFYDLSPDGAVSGKRTELLTDLPLDARSVSMPDAQTIYALSRAGGKPALYRFNAQGGWARIESATLPADGLQLQFVSPSDGFILQPGAVSVTADGGKTWVKRPY